MKKLFYTFALLFIASALFLGCGARRANNATAVCEISDVVLINGVAWATRNVERPGVFAATPESRGGHFTWADRHNVCPAGWRLPTQEELLLLQDADYRWTVRSGIAGRLFGMPPNQIFLPAAGWRDNNRSVHYSAIFNTAPPSFQDNLARQIQFQFSTLHHNPAGLNLVSAGMSGVYLSDTQDGYTWIFRFGRHSSIVSTHCNPSSVITNIPRSSGFSIRCVQE